MQFNFPIPQQNALSEKEFKNFIVSPSSIASTVYVADLPRNTSYLDLVELFEKTIGPCTIQIKR